MASASRIFGRNLLIIEMKQALRYSTLTKPLRPRLQNQWLAVVAASGCALYLGSKFKERYSNIHHVGNVQKNIADKIDFKVHKRVSAATMVSTNGENETQTRHISARERRFRSFASIEYDDDVYMTPQDFLESVTQDHPRIRKRRQLLSDKDVDQFLRAVPSRYWNSSKTNLFRQMSDKGILSYTEYLFLLCVLTKPKSGFQIAFNMFDTDMNQKVDKKEFLVINKILSSSKEQQAPEVEKKLLRDVVEEGFSLMKEDLEESELVERKSQDTTLLRYFFGASGSDKLTFADFSRFMDNLQTEVLHIEFTEYSKGMKTISESEFGRILLRHTKIPQEEQDEFIERVQEKIVKEEGITFEEFHKFFLFLNNLEDFTLAMNLYNIAGQAISQEDFQRAVKACVGYTLHPHLVETVFLMFDADGDGHLSQHEFICIMKDRLHRGLSTSRYNANSRFEAFKYCMKDIMKEQSSDS